MRRYVAIKYYEYWKLDANKSIRESKIKKILQ